MKHFIVVGIDPGNDGAIAVRSDFRGNSVQLMPTLEGTRQSSKGVRAYREYDLASLKRTFTAINQLHTIDVVILEHCQAMPKNGAVSMFNYGRGFGLIQGLLHGLGIRTELVKSPVWKKEILAGTPRDKAAAIAYCGRAFPDISLLATSRSKVAHDGMADALCMAEYGVRMFMK